jgi:hypothetical protein
MKMLAVITVRLSHFLLQYLIEARCPPVLRLHVVNRLRGRQPTPEPDDASNSISIVQEHNLKDVQPVAGDPANILTKGGI